MVGRVAAFLFCSPTLIKLSSTPTTHPPCHPSLKRHLYANPNPLKNVFKKPSVPAVPYELHVDDA